MRQNQVLILLDKTATELTRREAAANIEQLKASIANEERRVARYQDLKTKNMMSEFSKCYEEDRLDEARELIRKMQFMQKAKKEINELSSVIEDELY